MKIRRIIHPVGQGAFYSERFLDDNDKVFANVVYDCGSETPKTKIVINQLPSDKIDYFFLSHYHNDHFNGYDKFFNNSLKIDNLVMPQLTYKEAIYCLLSCNPNCRKSTQRLCTLLSNPHSIAHKIYLVAPINKTLNTHFLSNTQTEYTIHPSFKEIFIKSSGRYLWQYIPFFESTINQIAVSNAVNTLKANPLFANCTTSQSIFNTLINLLLTQYNIAQPLLKQIKKSNQNEFSMMLLSVPCDLENFTPLDPNLNNIHCTKGYLDQMISKPINNLTISKPGALYTGDIPMGSSINSINNVLSRYKHVLGTYQIPHHGSKSNYQPNIFPASEIHFLSVGTKNKYNHPTAILNSLHKLFIVTEDVSSELLIDFKF